MDPFTIALQLVFFVLFGTSVLEFVRHRGSLELSVMAVFASFAAPFTLSFLNTLEPSLRPIATPAATAVLFLQPYFVVRLIDQIHPVSARIPPLVLASLLLAWAAIAIPPLVPLAPADPVRLTAVLAGVLVFFGVQVWAGWRFVLDSRRRFGVARIRLVAAAIGTALFGTAILVVGVGSVASSGATNPGAVTASRVITVIAALAYLAAFMPPRWLRRLINRAASFNLVRALVAPEGDIGSVWSHLTSAAAEILGARRVIIVPAGGGEPLASFGPEAGDKADRRAPLSTVELEVRPGDPKTERLVAEIDGRPLFVDDDLGLLAGLCSLTARAIGREEMLVGLVEARRAAEESAAARASEARFRALLEAEPNAILALDEAGRVTWATRIAAELFGATNEQLLGTPLAELVVLHKDETPVVAGERPVFRSETTGKRFDGTHFPAEVARTTFELDGRPFQVAVISDVAWRHEADQIRERFLGVLSHELRTPVTSIYGGTQLLLGRGSRLDAATRDELLVSVAAEAERLQRMIENLVAMARIERGAEFGGTRPVLLDRIIRHLVERERSLWPEVQIKLVADGPVQMVAADEEYLAQIMRNLLSNAAKYSGPGSNVEVRLEDSEGEVHIRILDNGPGIPEDDVDRLFALYYRAAPHAATAPGAGIGLFVCRELVETMGGRIWARNRTEGGAEFGFSLPVYVDELEVAPVNDEPSGVFEREPQEPARQAAATGG